MGQPQEVFGDGALKCMEEVNGAMTLGRIFERPVVSGSGRTSFAPWAKAWAYARPFFIVWRRMAGVCLIVWLTRGIVNRLAAIVNRLA